MASSNVAPPKPCMRQPAYTSRLVLNCKDPNCNDPRRTHMVYILEGASPGIEDIWHLGMSRNLSDEVRCPASFKVTYKDSILNVIMSFPRGPVIRHGGEGGDDPKATLHGPMVGDSNETETLYWQCWSCEGWESFYPSGKDEEDMQRLCGWCKLPRDSTCVLEWTK